MTRASARAREGKRGSEGREAREGREEGKREQGENILKIYLTRSKQGTLTVIEAREKPSA